MTLSAPRLILASGSATRAALLQSAGVAFDVASPGVDEDAIKAKAEREGMTPAQTAMRLAEAKCLAVSAAQPDALVIGADQALDFDGAMQSKAPDIAAAALQLRALSGKSHQLLSAVCAARGGVVLWRHTGVTRMTMRDLPPAELGRYLDAAGNAALSSVGAYHYEGLGVHLFSAVDGDHATILGLPLLPLLAFLRTQGISFS